MRKKQLNIFDVEELIVALDLSKAKVKKVNEQVYTDVLVSVPHDATQSKDYETWDHMCYCLWKKVKCSYDEVIAKLEEHRVNKEPVEIRVPIQDGKAFFIPLQVVQYI
ncbi:hypothetical protein [Priestia taiwanensis]|uniref:Uncharacterized protein n=1 Tax=Priestia taiwanensis TaxID=1347902 RepID=A0A917AK23_9BACI|nr:hypothetical protein [Priestia taiwanensis]MBM7361972.1 hypothetical protein [Priestia taiwanensis]GGE58440.1 hypothetical protein GCM10007140_05990 [Priestia taiwanensis]